VSLAVRRAGDRGSLIDLPDNAAAVRVARLLRVERPDLVDVVIGHTTVLVTFAGEVSDLSAIAERALVGEPEPVGGSIEHVAAFLGFQPGFAYLTGGDELLHVPRREVPRTRVPGGTVAIAGPYSGVYPRDSPGGWRLLGSTATAMFDPIREPPALLAPGDRVRFVAV
jgi:KipI family sensor histidine kinase inhibitor